MAHKNAPARITAQEALQFHAQGKPGKLEITPTKPLATQRDLSLAYTPGVAVPVEAIAENPSLAYDYTNKGNLVAVVSNGTAILGLGNLGARAPSSCRTSCSSLPTPTATAASTTAACCLTASFATAR